MKKFTKILSLVLAVSLVASLFVVNVMAASKAHNITITATKADGTEATGLVAGDEVIVTLAIDNTQGLGAIDLFLVFDDTAFTADSTKGWMSMKDYQMHENYIDQAWYDTMKNDPLGNILGTQMTSVAGNEVYYAYAATQMGIPEAVAASNYVVGKFKFKVAADAVDGKYSFVLSDKTADTGTPLCNTMDFGENAVAGLTGNVATVTVGEGKQEATPSISTAEPTATEAGIAVERADGTKFTYDNCYTVTVSMTNANDATKAGMQFIPKKVYENADNTWTGYAEVEFAADGLGAGERAYTAALINIPRKLAGQNIDMMARGFMVVDGKTLTGTVVESVVNYKVTPEPGQN